MTTVRQSMEQAVLVSIGAAALTRERAEAAVNDLVRKGQMGSDEGKQVVERLMARVRGRGGRPRPAWSAGSRAASRACSASWAW